jgi:hypothetical protein
VAQTTANADAVLKNYYLGPIREQLNQKAVLMFNSDGPDGSEKSGETDSGGDGSNVSWRGISRESEGVEYAGRQWIIPAHTARNEGVGAIAEGGTIPVAGQQGWTDLQDTLRHNLGAIELTVMRSVCRTGTRGLSSSSSRVRRRAWSTTSARTSTARATATARVLSLPSRLTAPTRSPSTRCSTSVSGCAWI